MSYTKPVDGPNLAPGHNLPTPSLVYLYLLHLITCWVIHVRETLKRCHPGWPMKGCHSLGGHRIPNNPPKFCRSRVKPLSVSLFGWLTSTKFTSILCQQIAVRYISNRQRAYLFGVICSLYSHRKILCGRYSWYSMTILVWWPIRSTHRKQYQIIFVAKIYYSKGYGIKATSKWRMSEAQRGQVQDSSSFLLKVN
jgi:hypothetical protein